MKRCADLFCGAGGTSTGLLLAARELGQAIDLLAINHWNIAIDSHTRNHPGVRHLCESLDNVDPRKVAPGRMHLLCASPECTHHSNARGGRPCSDQSRASAWHIVRWAEALQPDNILVENVREFRNWGPLTQRGRPMKRKKGATYRAFLEAIRSLGYTVEDRILNAADYGDPTTRQRLFIMARRWKAIQWPSPSHGAGAANQWRAAREIIDWTLKGASIFGRKKALSPNTIRRIEAGLRKFGGGSFVINLSHGQTDSLRCASQPIPTITTARGGELALAEPFLIHLRGTGPSHIASSARSVEGPLRTLTGGRHVGLCEPFVLGQQSGAVARGVGDPLPTVATAGAIALIEPFLVKYHGTAGARPVGEPLDTVSTRDRYGLVEPQGEKRIDILFRMLQPHELAAAMSFPKNYTFAGTREAQVKQIGNAVPVRTAAALCKALLQ